MPPRWPKLRESRIKADEAEVAAALEGNWHDEHLFTLKQALALIDAYTAQITECDGKLQHLLGALKGHELPESGLGAPKRSTPANTAACAPEWINPKLSRPAHTSWHGWCISC